MDKLFCPFQFWNFRFSITAFISDTTRLKLLNMAVRVVKKNRARRSAGARAVTPARRCAFTVLQRVEEDGAFAAVLLAHATAELRADDRALCYELTLGVLRRQLWLDKLIEHYAGRDSGQIDVPVRRALRLGLYQLRFLSRVPASAAVNESVNLSHAARPGAAAKFVNAVLRRATREPVFDPAAQISDDIERLAVETSHPRWLVERWTAAFGADEAAAFAHANNLTPPVAFRANEWRAPVAEVMAQLREAGIRVTPSGVAPGAWRIEGTGGSAASVRELMRAGAIYTQDEASQLVAHVLGAGAGERVLDVCSAPGSKATHIAGLVGADAFVVAGDLRAHRLRVVVEAAGKQNLHNIHVVALDARAAMPFPDVSFDRVLVDAPCSGTGTLRHNPEIRWRITPDDIAELSARQQQILTHAAPVVRPGGRLVYSTCSIEPEENEAVIARFLATHENFRQEPVNAPAHFLTETGAARTWPHQGGTDGFFIAALKRKS